MTDARLRRVERELFLAALGVDSDSLEGWVIDRLTSVLEEHHLRAGQVLWPEDGTVEHIYFMHQGRVAMTREGQSPWIFQGRWFLGGFDSHLDRPTRRRAVALTDFYALRMPANSWLDLLEDSFDLARRAIAGMIAAVANLDARAPTRERPVHPVDRVCAASEGPLSMIERLAFLTELGMLRGAGVQALADLNAIADEITLEPSEVLIRPGAWRERFYIVLSGEVQAGRDDPLVERSQRTGEIVTGAAALAEGSEEWSARALGPARLLAVPIEGWLDLMEEHFGLARAAIRMLAEERETVLEHLAIRTGPEGLVLT